MGWNRGKEWKIREKLHYSFWAPLFCFLRWAKNKSYKISKLVSSTTVDSDTIPLHRYPTKLPSLSRVRARAFQQRCWFLLSQVSHSPFLRPLVLDFFSHFLPTTTSVPTLTNKRHVVFYKTTRRFASNDTSFFIKHHVVFPFIWTHIAHISKWML